MKSEQEIKDKIKELSSRECQALNEKDVDCAMRIESIIQYLNWVLEKN